MLRATADIVLPTAIIGSLPRPSWYTETLGARGFLTAMVNSVCAAAGGRCSLVVPVQ